MVSLDKLEVIETNAVQSLINVCEKLRDCEDLDECQELIEEALEVARDVFEEPGISVWSWDAYGDKELRFYVIDEESDIVIYIIYPFRARIERVNEKVEDMDSYFYEDIYTRRVRY